MRAILMQRIAEIFPTKKETRSKKTSTTWFISLMYIHCVALAFVNVFLSSFCILHAWQSPCFALAFIMLMAVESFPLLIVSIPSVICAWHLFLFLSSCVMTTSCCPLEHLTSTTDVRFNLSSRFSVHQFGRKPNALSRKESVLVSDFGTYELNRTAQNHRSADIFLLIN